VAAAATDADHLDLRRLQLLAEAHPNSRFLCCHASLNFPPGSPLAAESRASAPRAGSRGSSKHGFQFGYDVALTLRLGAPRLCCVQNQANSRSIFKLSDRLRHVGQSLGLRHANGQMEGAFGEFVEAVPACAAARENETRGNLSIEAAALEIVANQRD